MIQNRLNILKKVRKELKKNVDLKTKSTGERFFKEKIKLYGVKTGIVSQIAKKSFADIKDLEKAKIFQLCEKLWQSGYMEEAFVACKWSHYVHKQYEPNDFKIFERWINKYITNWATCDTLCNHTVGTFLDMYPKFVKDLKKWAKSKNRWVRRASAVSLIIPAKRGKFLKDIFEIADILFLDDDDLVQKGYGWMLKSASDAHQKKVFEYVLKNKGEMPRTALRYAIEKMPEKLRKKAMEK